MFFWRYPHPHVQNTSEYIFPDNGERDYFSFKFLIRKIIIHYLTHNYHRIYFKERINITSNQEIPSSASSFPSTLDQIIPAFSLQGYVQVFLGKCSTLEFYPQSLLFSFLVIFDRLSTSFKSRLVLHFP